MDIEPLRPREADVDPPGARHRKGGGVHEEMVAMGSFEQDGLRRERTVLERKRQARVPRVVVRRPARSIPYLQGERVHAWHGGRRLDLKVESQTLDGPLEEKHASGSAKRGGWDRHCEDGREEEKRGSQGRLEAYAPRYRRDGGRRALGAGHGGGPGGGGAGPRGPQRCRPRSR